jgi:hypothetical protein
METPKSDFERQLSGGLSPFSLSGDCRLVFATVLSLWQRKREWKKKNVRDSSVKTAHSIGLGPGENTWNTLLYF